jgi:hypothetical protein
MGLRKNGHRLWKKRKLACGKNGNRIGREIRNGLRRLLAEKEAIRKRGEAAWLLWKKGWMLGCCKKKGSAALYALAGEGRTNGVFKFLYVINASSIIIEYVSKCLARHHIREIREIRERKKHSAVMGTEIAQATQIFMLLAAQLGVSALQ